MRKILIIALAVLFTSCQDSFARHVDRPTRPTTCQTVCPSGTNICQTTCF